MKNLLTLLFAFLSINVYGQFSMTERDTLLTPSMHGANSAIVYDYNKDSFDDIIYINNNKLVLIEHNNSKYEDELVIFSTDEKLNIFSEKFEIDNDEFMDISVSTRNAILLLAGSSDGFIIYKEIPLASERPYKYFVIDYDLDNDLDIIYQNYSGIYLVENSGQEVFIEEKALLDNSIGLTGFFDFEIIDFDQDGDMDLVVFAIEDNSNAYLFYAKNLGENNFSIEKIIGEAFSGTMEIGDMNLDGYPDLVTIEEGSVLKIFTYSLENNFTISQTLTNGVYFNMQAHILMDYDNNGKTDIIVRNRMTDVMILFGNGDGTVKEAELFKTSIRRFEDFKIGNFNNDGHFDLFGLGPDLVTVLPLGEEVPQDSALNIPIRFSVNRCQYIDIDGDNLKDLVIISNNGGLFIYYGNESGISNEKYRIDGGYWMRDGLPIDMNKDGQMDFLLSHQSHSNAVSKLVWIKNLGSRNFSTPIDFKYLSSPRLVGICDYNKDGVEEVIAYEAPSGKIALFSVDNSDFYEIWETDATNILDTDATSWINVTFSDMNDDEWVDVVVGYSSESKVTYFPNNKLGGFDAEVLIYEGKQVEGVGVGNIDDDEKLELFVGVVEADYTSTIEIRDWDPIENKYGLVSEKKVNYYDRFSNFLIEDFDQNGFNDLVVGGNGSHPAFFFINDGTGKLENTYTDNLGQQRSICVTDFSGDGLKDLVSASYSHGGIYVNLNNSVFEPTVVETIFNIENTQPNTAKIHLNEIAADARIILMKKGSKVANIPIDNHFYSANTVFGSGENLDEETSVVCAGLDTSILVSGLEGGQRYYVTAFEYNLNYPQNTVINYLTSEYAFDSIFVKSIQTLKWDGPVEYILDNQFFSVQISASSGLPVSIELLSGPINYSDGIATIVDIGECTFSAVQIGNEDYFGADSIFTVDIVNITSLELEINKTVELFPNPFSNQLNIKIPEGKVYSNIQILDIHGKVIYQQAKDVHGTIQLDVPNLLPGIYVAEITSDSHVVRKKILH
jgi:hypothetical protein